MRPPRVTRGFLLVAVGSALILAGAATAVYANWADIRFELGLVKARYPYATNLHPGVRGSFARPRGTRLVIPRLDLNLPIGVFDEQTALQHGVYKQAGTANPGQPGNAVLAGHRIGRVFSLLHWLRRGDEVIVYWWGKEHDYKVRRVFEVPNTDTTVLAPGGPERLTLYTCKPRYFGNRRVVVIATPVNARH